MTRLSRAEVVLFVAGACGAAVFAAALLPRAFAQHHIVPGDVQAAATTPATTPISTADNPGKVIGELKIDSIHLRTPVLEGCTTDTLRQGSCRMSETATIGGLGTLAIAGHRDTDFRPLQFVRPGQDIAVTTADGTYHYRIDGTQIVTPEDVEVLSRQERPELILVTCYPFHYIGSAPKRFIVEAHLMSVIPTQ